MALLRFPYCLTFVLVAIFYISASCGAVASSADTGPVISESERCVLPPTTPDKTYTVTCPTKENCGTKPGEHVVRFAVMTSQCNPGYAQYQDGSVSSNHTLVNVCLNGTWAPNIPKCKKICNKLGSDELDFTCSQYLHGPRVPCNGTLLEGVVVVPRCKPLYHTNSRVNYRHVTCKADGTWDKEFFKCSNDCGRTRSSVINLIAHGNTEKRGDAPWHVAVYVKENSEEPTYICGGTLISTEFVISSAICFYDPNKNKKLDPQLFSIIVAKKTSDYKKMDYSTTKKYSVKTINYPEGALSNQLTYNSDLAVVQLSEPVTLSEDVLPACVNWDNSNWFTPPENTSGKLSGFGVTETGNLASELKTINIPYINVTDCLKQVGEDFRDQIFLGRFCAGSKTGPGARVGDSGGGLLFKDSKDGRFYLRGVASLREPGGTSISVFTDLSFFIPWMKKIIPTVNHDAK